MLASSSQATSSSDLVFVSIPKIGDALPNTHIFWLDPSETHRGYGCHAFHPSGRRTLDKEAVPVVFHQGTWYTLRHKAGNAFPHLGAERPDISLFDMQQPTQIEEVETIDPMDVPCEEPESNPESIPDPEDDSLLQAIRLTPLTTPIVRTSTPLPFMATTMMSTSTLTQTA